ncbi:hypothetical protein DFJ77DRAFT_470056 [Powellomyces hirtus]|nr:hypothetical protein DFJ77DRAFT_470056 [Powellomyces hirtus]
MDDSTLKSLSLLAADTKQAIALEPSFSRLNKHYSCNVGSDTVGVQIRAAANEADSFLQVVKGDADQVVSIREGTNDIEVKVDAPDGSSSTYVVSVYKPSAADTSLRSLSFSAGSLRPDYHRAETRYLLQIVANAKAISCEAPPLNPKATVVISSSHPETEKQKLGLFFGDTEIEFIVASADKTSTQTYRVTARKEKPHYRPRPSSETASDAETICSVCTSIVFRPRKYSRGESSCAHQFCFTCLDLLSESSDVAGDTQPRVGCPLCPNATWTNNPLLETDPEMEKKLGAILVSCPFTAYGCAEAALQMNILTDHVDECKFAPVSCVECGRTCVKAADIAGGKHKVPCTTQCECGAKIRLAESAYHKEQGGCPLTRSEKPEPKLAATSPWELALVDKKASSVSIDSCITAASQRESTYVQSLKKALQVSADTFGQSSVRPDTTLLDEAAALYATATAINNEAKATKGGAWDEILHVRLGLALEETALCNEAFPLPALSKTERAEVNENGAAAESFMSDEVDGLLEQLGVDKSANNPTKIRAIEAEYHRLLALGLPDEAAEVQGLHGWLIKKVASSSPVSGWNSSKGANAVTNLSAMHIVEKYRDALGINPASADANLHLGRHLLQIGQAGEAAKHLRTALGQKPMSKYARAMLGVALLSTCTAATPTEGLQEGISYLEETLEEYNLSTIRPQTPVTDEGMLTDRFASLYLTEMYLILAQAYRYNNQPVKSAAILSDLLYILPDILHRTPRRSTRVAKLALAMCTAQSSLLRVLPRCPGESSKLRMRSILNSLLRLTRRCLTRFNMQDSIQNMATDTAEVVAQALVALEPRNCMFLSALGSSQLDQFDKNYVYLNDVKKIDEAEQSFLAAIEAEHGHLASEDATVPPGRVKEQKWCIQWHQEASTLKTKQLAQTSKEPKPGVAKAGAKTPAKPIVSKPAAAKVAPSILPAKPAPPKPAAAKPNVGKPVASTTAPGNRRAESAARKTAS